MQEDNSKGNLDDSANALMDCLNSLDVSTLEFVKTVCDVLIASKSWNKE